MVAVAERIAVRRWPTSAWAYGALALAAIALWPSVASLLRIWGEMADYNHGYIVAAVILIWLATLRRKLDRTGLQSSWLALGALAVSLAMSLIAFRGSSELLQQLLLPVVLFSSVAAAIGIRSAMLIAAPLGYLYFAIPIWEYGVPLLQKLTTVAVQAALGALDVPATFSGPDVTLPSGQFTIAADCAGKRYLLVGLASAVLSGASQRLDARRTVVLLAITVGLAMVINWLRVAIIIYLGYLTEMQHYLVAVEHVTFGWFMFLPLLAAIFLVARRLGRSGKPDAATDAVDDEGLSAANLRRARMVRAQTAVLLLIVPVVAKFGAAGDEGGRSLKALPILTGAWQGPFPSHGWSPVFLGPDEQRQAAYLSGQRSVHVYVNLYRAQRQGRELVNYKNSVYGAGWSEGGATLLSLRRSPWGGEPRVARDESGREWVLVSSYDVDGSLTSSPLIAQMTYGLRALWRPVASGMIAMASPCDTDCAAAAEALQTFWRSHGSDFVAMLPREE
ncbi:MAG TPA: EpsI family protein [Steroidobacteraceae bacterium]|nr:EpsI family protein [Steroidobacteraceae bacterium]